MNITLGSTNPIKISALEQTILKFEELKTYTVKGINVDSNVQEQPKSFEETITGATNRAKACFKENLSFGIESGLVKASKANSGYIDITACIVFDGINCFLGTSSGFEYPKQVITEVFENGLDISQAFNKLKLTENTDIGKSIGAMGVLSKGEVPRLKITSDAIYMSLIPFLNKKLYL